MEIIFNYFFGIFEVQATETKKQLNLLEHEAALLWIGAFKARCRPKTKQMCRQLERHRLIYNSRINFFSGLVWLVIGKSNGHFTASGMAVNEIETVLKNYEQPRKRPKIAEETKLVTVT